MSGNSTEPGRTVTSKVAAILLSFTEQRPQSLTAIAHRSGLPVSTTYRITTELTRWQFLVRTTDGNYLLGPALPHAGPTSAPSASVALRRGACARTSPAVRARVAPVAGRGPQQ